MRLLVCRKEAKESGYWLRLIEIDNLNLQTKQKALLEESVELMKIFGAILVKSQ